MAEKLTVEQQTAALQKTNEGLKAEVTRLSQICKERDTEIEALKAHLATLVQVPGDVELPKFTIPTESFTVAKEKFKFLVGKFNFPGIGERSALEVLADKAKYSFINQEEEMTIAEYLVQIESSGIEKVK